MLGWLLGSKPKAGDNRLAALREQHDRELAQLLAAAAAVNDSDSREWDGWRVRFGLPATDMAQRERDLAGSGQTCGPSLYDLRKTLDAFADYYFEACSELRMRADAPANVHELVSHVRSQPDIRYQAFLTQVRPAVSMEQVYANASASSTRFFAGGTRWSLKTERCKGCGSPRAEANAKTCRYCGEPVLEG